eukprot:SAG31_NODE_272_length_18690_cov_14.520785_7_plen_85_part_00
MRPSNTVQRPSAPLGTQAQKCPPLGLGEEDLREAARLGLDEHDLEGLMEELAMKEFQHLGEECYFLVFAGLFSRFHGTNREIRD